MTALTGVIIGNQVRKADAKRKLEQEQAAQRYQQLCQPTPVYVPDQFLFAPQSPLNRPISPKFGSDTEDEGTYNPFFDPIKKRKANEARGRWREAKSSPSVSDSKRRELLYDRYNQEEKAKKAERGTARTSAMTSAGAGVVANHFIPDPTFSVGVGVASAVSGVSDVLGTGITNISDGLYKAARPKSPTRPNITKKVDARMKKLEEEREQKRELQKLKEERIRREKEEREERLRRAAERAAEDESAKSAPKQKSSSWFSW